MEPHEVEGRSSAQPMAGGEPQAWRVLIADEEAEVRSQLSGLMRGWDCETLEAADGAAALEFLRQGVVDAAFVNAQLPGVSGWEVYQAAQGLDRQVPVILFSTTGIGGAEVQSMKSGTTEEVSTRPVDRDDLIQAIQRVLEGCRLNAETDARREQEARLYQSHKLEAIGRLATGVAHDFNNLLTIIMGYSEIVLGSLPNDDPNRSPLEQIHRAGDRAAALARQLLAFGRKQPFTPMLLDLSAVVTDLDKMLQRLIGEDIELITHLEPAPWRIRADPGQIEQVIVNLVLNARDAMPEGGKLSIETGNLMLDESAARWLGVDQAGQYVMLTVTDSGCGMDAETQARLFEPFFTTKEEGKGTGLGLSIVHDIVRQGGGAIRVCSELGRGTTFTIYWPADEGHDEIVPTSVAAQTESLHGWQTILVAEDDDDVRRMVREMLERYGYTVLEAREAEDAIRTCEHYRGPIHLLVTDVVMRHISGSKLVEHLTPLRPGMRALYISGYTAVAVAQHGVLNPNKAFLQKPFTPEQLAAKVKEVLEATPTL